MATLPKAEVRKAPVPMRSLPDSARVERAVLACVLESPELWPSAELSTDDFLLSDHQMIWGAICAAHADGETADVVTIATALDGRVDFGYVSALLDDSLPANFNGYVRAVRNAAVERKFSHLHERLGTATGVERAELLEAMGTLLTEQPNARNWRGIFHSIEEFENAAPLRFAISGFLQDAGVTLIGGLAGHGKTLAMLSR